MADSCETAAVQTLESMLYALHLLYHSDTRLLFKKNDVVCLGNRFHDSSTSSD